MYNLTGLSFKVMTYTHEMQRLRSGPLLKDLIHNMQGRVNGSLDRRMKMFMYSAHDTTVASLLNTLEVYDDVPPPYASCVILELQKNISSGQSFVRVRIPDCT
jgi:lysosomal acid phosphatase